MKAILDDPMTFIVTEVKQYTVVMQNLCSHFDQIDMRYFKHTKSRTISDNIKFDILLDFF